jgi:hypothetical protein
MLTPTEKVDHTLRTRAAAFAGSDEEHQHLWEAIPAADEPT